VALRDMREHRLKDLSRPERIFQVVVPDLPSDFPSLRVLDSYTHNLPAQATALIGRETEVLAVDNLIRRESVRLLTLTGPGGIGKSRLALQAAADLLDDFHDGVYFVPLAPIHESEFVLTTIAQALGLTEQGDRSLDESLKAYLRSRQTLLLLDNFEQVATAGSLVSMLLAAAPDLKVLITSREVLHLYGEHEYSVPPLSLPDLRNLPPIERLTQYEAVRLFIERAQAVRPDFAINSDNAPAVAEICTRLDGLPLAIELAAARSKLFPPKALLARLDKRLALLTGGPRDLPARQQTLRNAIAWSYDLLDAAEQAIFARLGVFVGGCTFEAAETVLADDQEPDKGDLTAYIQASEVLQGLTSLVDKSLLKQDDRGGEPRFAMLETIGEYALERLAASGANDVEVLRRRHAQHFLTLAEQAEQGLAGVQSALWLKRLDAENGNLRAALEWSLADQEEEQSDRDAPPSLSRQELGLRLAGALLPFWDLRSQLSEGRAHLAAILAHTSSGPSVQTVERARALHAAGWLAFLQGDHAAARALTEEGLALARRLDYEPGIAASLITMGLLVGHQDATLGQLYYEESLSIAQRLGNIPGIATALIQLGTITWCHGQPASAVAYLEQCLALCQRLGDKQGIMSALSMLGVVAWSQGDDERATALVQESMALARELEVRGSLVYGIINLGQIAWTQGDYARAQALHTESLALAREAESPLGIANSLRNLGTDVWAQGDYARAITLHQASLPLYWSTNDIWGAVECIEGLGWAACSQGQAAGDAACFTRAARLLGAAATSRESTGNPMAPAVRAANDRVIADTRAQLGETAFAAAWAAGRALTFEEAIAEALAVAGQPPE